MPQKDKRKSKLTLDTIAKELAAVAYDLANDQIRIGSSLISIGDPLFIKSKQKVKDDKAYFTLSFQVPLQDEKVKSSSEEVSKAESHANSKKQGAVKSKQSEFKASGAPEAKKLKKEIGRVWKSVASKIEQDQLPLQAEAEKLLKKCEDYNVFVDPSWQAQWASCCKDVKKCLDVASKGEIAIAKNLVDAINSATRACHKKYK